MPGAAPVGDLLEVAASTAPLRERAQAVVEALQGWLPADAVWLAAAGPGSTETSSTLASTGLDRAVLAYLDRPEVGQEIRLARLDRERPPIGVRELPVPVEELPTWADCMLPAGFDDGLGVPLCEAGGAYVGMLGFFFADRTPVATARRQALADLAPLIARGVSTTRTLLGTSRLVSGATAGAVVLDDGTTQPLPGLGGHDLLGPGSRVVRVARDVLEAGQVYRSFLWPASDPDGVDGQHVRVTVLAAHDLPYRVLGTALVTPHGQCRGLTPRELEVLGLVVDGLSNQQVARRLAITPRTVATHVEHILVKLEVPSRTLAAVHAEREGCYVPSAALGRG